MWMARTSATYSRAVRMSPACAKPDAEMDADEQYEKFVDDRDVTKSFITMYLDHGTNPTDADYAYIILPGKSSEETAAYSAGGDVEIIANTKPSRPCVRTVWVLRR